MCNPLFRRQKPIKKAFSSPHGTKRPYKEHSSWFHPPSVSLERHALMTANVVKTCTLLSRCRLARGIFPLLVGALSAVGASSLQTLERDISRILAVCVFKM